ncbi:hypothetical protein CRG98_013906 [Punica granatum]|uniref:Uncharacterized protein n=1 Tax=Punica granatum TaxID=22663 RepID=A0A2I0KB15_PUNGR|nr:hypothetical protein CRG98_013906 [Punica granatum]
MKLRAFSAALSPPAAAAQARRSFRSDAALEAIARASGDRVPNVALYNYPSFSGAFSALFARLFHDRLGLPCLILPFSSVEPLRVEDLYTEGIERCYLLDLLGPREFLATLAQRSSCKIIAFDHRKCMLSRVPPRKAYPENVSIYINTEKSSSFSVYEYFSAKLMEAQSPNDGAVASLFEPKDRDRVETVLKYIEDGDLRRWSLTDIRAFNIGSSEWRSKLNCVTNPYMYEQGVRADGSSDLSDEIGKQLSLKSAASGLRPIGAVIYMQRNNLKMCLRSIDDTTDTSEVAKGTDLELEEDPNCWLKRRNIWSIQPQSNSSWGSRRILKLREVARPMISCPDEGPLCSIYSISCQ